MPDLLHSLHSHDLGHLRIVASLWGVELAAVEPDAALSKLTAALLDSSLLMEVVEALPAEARAALDALVEEGGRIQWAAFARRFGEVREVGAGRRDREQVYLNPISAAEILFYRALLARAFFDTSSGLQEFAYIPDDLLALLSRQERKGDKKEILASLTVNSAEPLGRPAMPKERAHIIPANDRILDDACTLLAALRLGWQSPPHTENWRCPPSVLTDLLITAQLIIDSTPQPEPMRAFLEAPRGEALATLVKAWQESETFNELRQIPGLVCEGEWKKPPLETRHSILGFLSVIPRDRWWSIPAFIHDIKEKYPDFQRPAGDYDSWFIKREADGEYLRGFEHWDEVDGALIRYIITGPLHWLGLADLATPEEGAHLAAFRLTTPDSPLSTLETGKLSVSSNGRISVPRLVPRAARYQIARFCEWEESVKDEYHYRVTPASLTRARQQKLKPEQSLVILRKHAAAPLPPPFIRALQRWELKGTEARMEQQVILRLGSPAVLKELRKSKAARFLGEVLGPTAIVVKPGAQAKILAALAELGLLADDQASVVSKTSEA